MASIDLWPRLLCRWLAGWLGVCLAARSSSNCPWVARLISPTIDPTHPKSTHAGVTRRECRSNESGEWDEQFWAQTFVSTRARALVSQTPNTTSGRRM